MGFPGQARDAFKRPYKIQEEIMKKTAILIVTAFCQQTPFASNSGLFDTHWENDLKGVWHLSQPQICANGENITDTYFSVMNSLIAGYNYTIDEDESARMALTISFSFAGIPLSMEYFINKAGEEESFSFMVHPSTSARESHGSHDFYLEKYGEDSLAAFFKDEKGFCKEGDFTVSYMIREKHNPGNPEKNAAYP